MLTIEKLRAYGANVDEGIKRCIDDKDFYLSLVDTVIPDTRIDDLEAAIKVKNYDKAFEIAHALKGMYGNIALTPIYDPISQMTELLRSRTDTDYSALLQKAKEQKKKLVALNNS